MADPQVLSIDLGPLPAGASAFRLRFSADGEATWTNYSTTDPAGAVAEEIPVSALTGTVYLLDGINSLTGNKAAASAVGVVLEGAWKAGGLWSRWGPAAEAVVSPPAPGWPTVEDSILILAAFGEGLPDGLTAPLTAQLPVTLPQVRAEFEALPAPDGSGGTGRLMTPTVGTRYFNGEASHKLYVDEFVPAEEGGTAITITDTISSTPITGARADRRNARSPWTRLVLPMAGGVLQRFPIGPLNIAVQATWGWGITIPADVVGAVAWEAARRALIRAAVPLSGIGESDTLGGYSINTAAGVSVWVKSSPIGVAETTFRECVARYRNPAALAVAQGMPAGYVRMLERW